jgi:hypothetical protein
MRSIYFEFTYRGSYVKVAAIDAGNGLEVSIVGPVGTPQLELEKLALKKLEFIRQRLEQEGAAAKKRPDQGEPSDPVS